MKKTTLQKLHEHTVSVGSWYSQCMNCDFNYLGGKLCANCGHELLFAASRSIIPEEDNPIRDFCEENELIFVGYVSDGQIVILSD